MGKSSARVRCDELTPLWSPRGKRGRGGVRFPLLPKEGARGRSVAALAFLLLCASPVSAATLNGVRSIGGHGTTLVIVELSGIVTYTIKRTAARPGLGVPARVQVDLQRTRLRPNLSSASSLSIGPVKRVRAAQPGSDSTRVLIDIEDGAEFGAVPMTDPFRLVVNVHRPEGLEPPAPPPPPVLRPAPPPGVPLPRPQPPPPILRPPHRLKIVLDPGHGGTDPGAVGIDDVAEKDVVLRITKKLQSELAALGEFDVVLTRDTDIFVPLEERTARANVEDADLFVSIHANASASSSSHGVETYYLNNTQDRATLRLADMENGLRDVVGGGGPDRDTRLILSSLIQNYKVEESTRLAQQVQDALVASLKSGGAVPRDLGVKRGPFYVLVGAGMPCVLVEVSFLTHPKEGRLLAQDWYQAAIANGLLRGIRRFAENAREARNL